MNNYKQPFFLLLFLVFSPLTHAQEPIYKHFGVDEGLPSSEIYDICQDQKGYIWFATDKGLSRYNGYEFENFNMSDGLPGNVILRLYPQENGDIWGYTLHNKALFYFNGDFKGFTHYKYNNLLAKEFSSNDIVKSFTIDVNKTIHLGGNSINGEILIDKNGVIKRKYVTEKYSYKYSTKYNILNNYSKSGDAYFSTTNKNIKGKEALTYPQKGAGHIQATWLEKNKKALFMDGEAIHIVKKNKRVATIKNQFIPLRLKAIDSTRFFAGFHYGGSKIYNDKGKVLQYFLKEKSVTNFLIDHEGGYWFTTLNSGVYYIKKPSILVYNPVSNNKYPHINSLVKTKNELLIGYNNGDFGEILSDKTFNYEKSTTRYPPALVEYDFISNTSYIYKNNAIFINKVFVSNLYALKLSETTLNGSIFSSNPNFFYDINKKITYPYNKRVLDVCLSKKDTLIATPSGVFKKDKDRYISLSKESKLLSFRSDDIDVSNNRFFIATQGAGVVIYDEEIYNISKKEGLTDNVVNEIHIENDSVIWACTNKGLNRIVFYDKGYSITNINKSSGLLSNEVEDIEIINDTLWVGTREGLCYMPKKIVDKKDSKTIYLKLKEVKVNDSVYNFNEKIKLDYNQNKINFFVEAISYAKNNDLEYEYRLKEIDTKWTRTKSRNISFPNQKDGTYTFQVRACLGNKCYSKEQLEYVFIIKPPFWKSSWFYTLCFLAFGGLIYLFFRIRVLTYNKDIIREFFRVLIKRLKREGKFLEIRMNGEDVKIATNSILLIKSSGNYLDIICVDKIYTIRCKIGDFIAKTPDTLEYLRIHRSYIIRIDKVTGKSKKSVTIKEHIIPVGETYVDQLDNIHF